MLTSRLSPSRARRNRYRRRPSRLTALGKAAVATTVTGLLALGWASQASRRPDAPPAPEAESSENSEPGPVSAPPRWPAAPSLGAIAAPERDAIPADPNEVRRPPAAAAAPDALAGQPASTAVTSTPEPAPSAADSAPSSAPTPAFAAGLRAVLPPTSRARFEEARTQGRTFASGSAAPAFDSSLAAGPSALLASPGEPRSAAAARPRLVEWIDARALGLPGGTPGSGMSASGGPADGRVRVEYSLDEALTASVFVIGPNSRAK